MIVRAPASLRWAASFVIVLGAHVGGAAALLAHLSDDASQSANAPVVMVELSPVSASPNQTDNAMRPDIVEQRFQSGDPTPVHDKPEEVVEKPEAQPETENVKAVEESTIAQKPDKPMEIAKVEPLPEPQQPVDIKPTPDKPADLAVLPPPKPKQPKEADKTVEKKKEAAKKKPQQQAVLDASASAADRKAERLSAAQASAADNGNAMPDWRAKVTAAIARARQYPADAQQRGEQGTAGVSFQIDGSGHAHNVRLQRSTGSRTLDSDAVAWIMRAQPFPPPPGEKAISLSLNLNYGIR